jgi:hypothetical protein
MAVDFRSGSYANDCLVATWNRAKRKSGSKLVWRGTPQAVLLLLLAWATGKLHRRLFITLPLLMVLLGALTRLM